MKYNYIIFNLGDDFYSYLTIPLSGLSNVHVYKNRIDKNRITNTIFFYHWSHKINKKINLPLKNLWFRSMYSNSFCDNKPICFVFAGGKYISESADLRKYILKQNPNNKCVIYCGDLIAKKDWDVEKVKCNCDAIVTYDPGEAKKYGIYCYDRPLYGRIAPLTTPDTFDYDVFFLGFAKDRLSVIIQVYRKLTDAGLKCKFIVCGVNKADRTEDGIDYSEPISYAENIAYVNRSKCILELIQGSSNTSTLRREESIIYKRKLLTNFVGMKDKYFFNPDNMSVFSSPEDIDTDFIRSPIRYDSFADENELAPTKLLDFFEEILEKQNG